MGEQKLGARHRIGEAGGLDEDPLELGTSPKAWCWLNAARVTAGSDWIVQHKEPAGITTVPPYHR